MDMTGGRRGRRRPPYLDPVHDFSPTPRRHLTTSPLTPHQPVGSSWRRRDARQEGGGHRTPASPRSLKEMIQPVQVLRVRGAQFEALLLEELDVEATAIPDEPDDATDLRM